MTMLLAGVLAGCAGYQPKALDPAQSAARYEGRSLDDPALKRFLVAVRGGAPTTWDLDALTLAALYFHPDLDIVYARLATAKGAVATARQRPNPSIGIVPEVDPASAASWTVGAVISFLVETAGKRDARVAEARDLADAARADLDAAAWQVRGRVRASLVDLWLGGQRAQLAGRRLQAERELVTLLEHRLAIGEASALDVSRERANRDQAELAWRDARRSQDVARAQLAVAVGLPATALQDVTLAFDGLGGSPPADASGALRRAALGQRPDVRAAVARYQAADAALRLQLANRIPNLTLAPGYNDQGDRKASLPVGFDLPVFNQNQGPIAEAAGRRKEAAAQLLALQAQIGGAIDAAQAGHGQAAEALSAADRLQGEQQARQARAGKVFTAGELDRPALLAGEVEVLSAQAARLDALAAERQAAGQLEDALEIPFFDAGRPVTAPPEASRVSADP